jgi:hypothetical protein
LPCIRAAANAHERPCLDLRVRGLDSPKVGARRHAGAVTSTTIRDRDHVHMATETNDDVYLAKHSWPSSEFEPRAATPLSVGFARHRYVVGLSLENPDATFHGEVSVAETTNLACC